jgi:hypothetical protein
MDKVCLSLVGGCVVTRCADDVSVVSRTAEILTQIRLEPATI